MSPGGAEGRSLDPGISHQGSKATRAPHLTDTRRTKSNSAAANCRISKVECDFWKVDSRMSPLTS